jgi:hypothetical protein
VIFDVVAIFGSSPSRAEGVAVGPERREERSVTGRVGSRGIDGDGDRRPRLETNNKKKR